MKSRILRAALLAIAPTLVAVVLGATPAQAAVTNSVRSIDQCSSSGSCSSAITYGSGLGHSTIQITASESAALLDAAPSWVRLSVRPGSSGSFTCLKQWATSSKSFSAAFNWDTTAYPQAGINGCSGSTTQNGQITANGVVQFQVTSSNGNPSAIVSINLNNAPSTPQWAASPSVSGASKRAPVVTLKWSANPEPDVKEYRFLRTDPAGNTKQYPVDAANPSAQGCSFDGATYTCYDTDFPSTGFGGTYNYALAVYRASPSQADTCYYPDQQSPCIGTTSSDVRSASLVEPTPSPTATGGTGGTTGGTGGTVGSGGGTTGGGVGSVPTGVPSVASANQSSQPRTAVQGQTFNPGDCFTCGTYGKTLPYGSLPGDGQSGTITVPGSGQGPIAAGAGIGSGSSGPDPRQLWVSVAAGLVLLLTAGHVARVLRSTAG